LSASGPQTWQSLFGLIFPPACLIMVVEMLISFNIYSGRARYHRPAACSAPVTSGWPAPGSCSAPAFLDGQPILASGRRAIRPGEAHRVRRPKGCLVAMAASWIITAEEDGCTLIRPACRRSHVDLRVLAVWLGVRRAASSKAEPGADAGPAAPQ